MEKEIVFYTSVYPSSVADFIGQMQDAKGNDVCVRVNTPGGDTLTGMGMIAKYNEHAKGKKIKVDGMAMSFGAFLCCYADDVECLESSQFLFHRSAFPDWVESDPEIFTAELKTLLTRNNSVLRKGMEGKLDLAKFVSISGKTLDDMFSLDSRIDIRFTAAEAKEIGLVNKVIPLNSEKKKEINSLCSSLGMAAAYTETTTTTQITVMTAAEFKTANPAAYAEIVKEGVTAEQTRVNTLLVYISDDTATVVKAIKDGATLDPVMSAELGRKIQAKAGLATIAGEAAPVIETGVAGATVTAEAAAIAKFNEEVKANRKTMII